MYPQPEVVLLLAEQIVNQKKALAKMEEQWASMFSALPVKHQIAVAAKSGRAPSNDSAKRRIQRLLNEHPDVDFDADTVASQLGIHPGTVRTNLSKLVGAKYRWIEKRSPNTYGAISSKEKETTSEEIAS